jgi:asparagine synthase (glutamine-hydrolysing)
MCGITGYFSTRLKISELSGIGEAMTTAIMHRGPNDAGLWVSSHVPLVLGHRRLSIVELSAAGHQPMLSQDERYVLTFNGEIYNYRELRKELEELGFGFRGASDTEVMLAAFQQWGVIEAVKRFVGMFAFGLWDQRERILHLGRDRMGEKPLYYGWHTDGFYFGSELKALRATPSFNDGINKEALSSLVTLGYVAAPLSIYEGVFKLPQASVLTLTYEMLQRCPGAFIPQATANNSIGSPVLYWVLKDVAARGMKLEQRSDSEWIDSIESHMREAVRLQMVADVPVGAFLSGGVDSSTIVAIMQAQSSIPVRTFSIGFVEREFNEAHFAARVAKHLNTSHTDMMLTMKDCLAVIPKLPTMYDEPFADSSQIPTVLVSELARGQVTVSLSGDGGDELFCGYLRYAWSHRIAGWSRMIPKPISMLIDRLSEHAPAGLWSVIGKGSKLIGMGASIKDPGTKAKRVAELLTADDFPTLYRKLVSLWSEKRAPVLGAHPLNNPLVNKDCWPEFNDVREFAMFVDQALYLPDDILTKIDRAAMAVALETRVPLLDHRLVEASWQLPFSLKVRNGETKWIMRQILSKYVPLEYFERPKMGFAVPLAAWLRGPLRAWADELLSEHKLSEHSLFDTQLIRAEWQLHVDGKADRQYALWPVLMFQAWSSSFK